MNMFHDQPRFNKLNVTVFIDSNGTHLHQIYTGLFLLHQQGIIDLVLRKGISQTDERPNRQFLAINVSDNTNSANCIFDLQDSSITGLPSSFDWCDVYFKRSLATTSAAGLAESQANKLKPFGFNYQVLSSSKIFFLKRFLLEFLSRPYNPFSARNGFHISNLKEYFEAIWKIKTPSLLGPDVLNPYCGEVVDQVMFQCRLWDPAEIPLRNRDDASAVNFQRIELIRRLKAELGHRFVGGLQHNAFAKRVAPDLLISSASFAQRMAYINLVKRSAVVISSAGLLDSNGWKLGEYVALGKCIVSEPLITQLPGDFIAGRDYSDYQSVDECVEIVTQLLQNKERIHEFSSNTANYYYSFLSPTALMMRHLATALEMARAEQKN